MTRPVFHHGGAEDTEEVPQSHKLPTAGNCGPPAVPVLRLLQTHGLITTAIVEGSGPVRSSSAQNSDCISDEIASGQEQKRTRWIKDDAVPLAKW